jgi:hypothetical protein
VAISGSAAKKAAPKRSRAKASAKSAG